MPFSGAIRIGLKGIGLAVVFAFAAACDHSPSATRPVLHWYVFDEPSGSFAAAARRCSEQAKPRYRIELKALPTDADQQREQLARRLAAGDREMDILGMDVIWTAEFAAAGWIRPWRGTRLQQAKEGRIETTLDSATYDQQLWAIPFTSNTQLLWYRSDRVDTPPQSWCQLITRAESMGAKGLIEAQGQRYEGLTVLFTSLLASAGGQVLNDEGTAPSLARTPTRRALQIMRRLANSDAAPPGLASQREDDARLGFESGRSSFMLNYTYVWPSAHNNAPHIAEHMRWARWPRVDKDIPSRVTLGGINLGISAFTRHPRLAFEAATCLASEESQRYAARHGGLPPTIARLYDAPEVRAVFPFADTLRATLRDAVQRPQTPLYYDVSLAISHTLHPMRQIDPQRDTRRLREAVARALQSEGLL